MKLAITHDIVQPEQPAPQLAVSIDEPLVARLRDRDPDAFDQMVVQEAPQIQRLVSRLLGWESSCDDVVQEVFMAAWEKIDHFRGEANISSWLYSIALNQCRKHRRGRGRWRRLFRSLDEHTNATQLKIEHLEHTTIDEGESPDARVAAIHRAINQLAQGDRELIVLCSLEGKSIGEAGTLLGVRKNTLEVRLHRARQRLKKILNDQLEEH